MGLLRFDCYESISHGAINVEVPDAMRAAYADQIEVMCPQCNVEMEPTIVDGDGD